ncbi:hypothetical protein OUZ56_028384 [Daphnia magna]|uniref:Uncharacterized protein n=1 Tax=Daphnia magna TaxID=35525 RepID=A0ABR0B3P7_9CRUS|nr:hypothetical protein OUZ56_028384 [Daphnia magna]
MAPLSQNMPSNEANNIDVLLSGILQEEMKWRARGETIYSHRSPLDHQTENAIEMHGKKGPPFNSWTQPPPPPRHNNMCTDMYKAKRKRFHQKGNERRQNTKVRFRHRHHKPKKKVKETHRAIEKCPSLATNSCLKKEKRKRSLNCSKNRQEKQTRMHM